MADLSQFLTDEIAGAVPASTGVPDPVPEGDYDLQLVSTELSATRDETGVLLNSTFEIVTGEYEGRKIFTRFNVRNKSAQAQSIGIGEFKALCLAVSIPYEEARNDTSMLEYKPFRAKVGLGVETDKATGKPKLNPNTNAPYAPKNSIKKFYPFGETAPASAPAATAPAKVATHVAAAANVAAAGAASGAKPMPWIKK